MATQKYKALASTTLGSAYTAASGTLALSSGDGSKFPTSGDFYIGLGSPVTNILKVTARSTDTLTVVGGQDGTSDANAASATPVTLLWTALTIDGVRSDICQTGTFGSIPAAEKNGILYLPSDGFGVYRDTGSAFVSWGPLFQFTDPTIPTWSWVNQNSATVTTTNGGIFLSGPATATGDNKGRGTTAPGTPYTITIAFLQTPGPPLPSRAGFFVSDSGTGKLITFGTRGQTGYYDLRIDKWTNTSTFSAQYTAAQAFTVPLNSLVWLRFTDDGTNFKFLCSSDGINFAQSHSVSRTDFLASPNQVGFYVNASSNNTIAVGMNVVSWKQS